MDSSENFIIIIIIIIINKKFSTDRIELKQFNLDT